MTYYFSKTLDRPFDQVVAATREALGQEGFGVITEIDVRQTMKAKIGEEFRPYLILGACNPRRAYEALKLEDKVGTMLNDELKLKAAAVAEKLRATLDRDVLHNPRDKSPDLTYPAVPSPRSGCCRAGRRWSWGRRRRERG